MESKSDNLSQLQIGEPDYEFYHHIRPSGIVGRPSTTISGISIAWRPSTNSCSIGIEWISILVNSSGFLTPFFDLQRHSFDLQRPQRPHDDVDDQLHRQRRRRHLQPQQRRQQHPRRRLPIESKNRSPQTGLASGAV